MDQQCNSKTAFVEYACLVQLILLLNMCILTGQLSNTPCAQDHWAVADATFIAQTRLLPNLRHNIHKRVCSAMLVWCDIVMQFILEYKCIWRQNRISGPLSTVLVCMLPELHTDKVQFLAMRTSSHHHIATFAICRRPSICRAPYSGDWNFLQCFYTILYIGYLWPFGKNFTEIVPGEPVCQGLNKRGVVKYSHFGPFQGYISETVQDKR